jgi:hypothetical protein
MKFSKVGPKYLASKRKRRKREIEDPERVHRELKNFLLKQKLVVERSVLPEKRAVVDQIETYLTYLRSLEKK